jgi:hypothetical protein
MIRGRVDGAEIAILPAVKGLVSEGDAVAAAIRELMPDAVGISVSREELEALRDKSIYSDYEMSALEKAYAENLSSFGEVELPSPSYVSALDTCQDLRIPLIPLDMNDAEYTELYCKNVRAADMVRDTFFSRRADRKRFDLSSPLAFTLDWDSKVNRTKGFRELQRGREEHMATALRNMTRKHRHILAVVEAERAEGVGTLLTPRPTT